MPYGLVLLFLLFSNINKACADAMKYVILHESFLPLHLFSQSVKVNRIKKIG